MKKILIFTSKFPPDIGGVEKVTYRLSHHLRKQGYTVRVITSLKTGSFRTRLSQNFEDIPLDRVFMSCPRSLLGLLALPYRFAASILQTRSILKSFNPDVVNFHFPDDSVYYFYVSTIGLNKPIYVNIHGNEIHLFSKSLIYRFVLNRIFKKSKAVIVNTNYMKKELKNVYGKVSEKTTVIPNGVDINTKHVKIAESPDSYYLFVGRFDKKKGLDILITAYNRFANETERDLLIIGSPVEDGKPTDYYKKLAQTRKIKFLGRKEKEELFGYYKNAYYCVFPSKIEPFGIVALESMLMGTPVIASDNGGFSEIMEKTEGGILFKNGNIKNLMETLRRVESDPKLKDSLSTNAAKNIKLYNWENIVDKYIELFNDKPYTENQAP